MNIELFQEKVSATGGYRSEGVQRVLGTPAMNWLTIVLREAVQNSWDARIGDRPVSFHVQLNTLSVENRNAIKNDVITDEPPEANIRKWLDRESCSVLILSDTGTRGLGGPTKATDAPVNGEKRDFVDFVWEIGRTEIAGRSGGTYGFGKTAYYRLSKLRTVFIHSRCKVGNVVEDRFIAAHLGPSNHKFTGRSWWGRIAEDMIQPVTGHEAVQLAAKVGMPQIPDEDYGTSIMILEPNTANLDNDESSGKVDKSEGLAAKLVKDSIVQWFWPRMTKLDEGEAAIAFRFTCNGKEEPLFDPRTTPPISAFTEALMGLPAIQAGTTGSSFSWNVIECGRPRARLGWLVLVKRPKRNRPNSFGNFGDDTLTELVTGARHVALMRGPRLIVKYLSCHTGPAPDIDYAGVFVVDSDSENGEVEKAFALSEPATHDDWIPDSLENGRHKTFVRVALRRIKESFNAFIAPSPSGVAETPQNSLGAFSESLGELLAGTADGTGARIQPDSISAGGGGGNRKRPNVVVKNPVRLHTDGNIRYLDVPFAVSASGKADSFAIRVSPLVLLENGVEKDPPAGAGTPKVQSYMRIENGEATETIVTDGDLQLTANDLASSWVARMVIPEDTKVRVEVVIVN